MAGRLRRSLLTCNPFGFVGAVVGVCLIVVPVWANDLSPVRVLLADAAKAARTVDDGLDRDLLLSSIGDIQAETGDIDAALKTAARIKDSSSRYRTIIAIAGAQARRGDRRGALDTASSVRDHRGMQNRVMALREITIGLAQAGDLDGAVRVARSGGNDAAMSGVLAVAARELARAGQRQEANELFQESLKRANVIPDEFEREAELVTIAQYQAEAGDSQAAWATIQPLPAFHRDRTTKALACVQADAGDLVEASQTAEKVENVSSKGLAIQCIAVGYARSGDYKTAMEVSRKVVYDYARSYALAQVGRIAAQTKNAVAPTCFEESREAAMGIAIESSRNSALVNLVAAQADAGDLDGATRSTALIASPMERDRALAFLAGGHAAVGDLDAALKTVGAIKGERVTGLAGIARRLAELGAVDQALALPVDTHAPEELAWIKVAVARGLMTRLKEPADPIGTR